MRYPMKKCIRSALGALSFTLVSGLASAQGNGETVRFQEYPGIGNLLVKVAKAKGFCKENGIKCELVVIPSGALGAQALAAGSIDVSLIPIETQAGAITKGADFVGIVGGIGSNTAVLVVSSKVELPNAAKGLPDVMHDLKGKKVGVSARGTHGEFQVLDLLRDAGMAADDVTFVAVGGLPTALPALMNGQIDAVLGIEPLGVICAVTKQCRVVYSHAESTRPASLIGTRGASAPLQVRRTYLAKNPQTVNAIRASVVQADDFIQNPANFAEVLKIVKESVKLDMPQGDEILVQSLQTLIPHYRASIDRAAAGWGAKEALAQKMADREVKVDELLDSKAP
jgi:NitT/TauT family transport system substrate-binding protein